ncbi:membrane protein implicated in regulation of membrane protease activity [Streptomyces sp. TE3672]
MAGTDGQAYAFSQQERLRAAKEAWTMSNSAKIAIGGVVVAVILMPFIGFWLSLLVLIGVPAVAYLLLDPGQRRRLRRITRKEIGR